MEPTLDSGVSCASMVA
ncbi:hypothetical protein F383_23042 [Gossypium arboreum]|uniref:Uncharacterized protein n=1 Tax=Gossypium arboreum TaxID=29729 RepID=A0A0B0NMV2_GOSAR|nr:hypothetical protein F383_23042 [Gossypium arboreum]